VNNCTVGTGHGLSIGAQTDFGVSGFRVTNCSYNGTDYVVRLKSERGEGGLVANVLYDHITYTGIGKAVIYISSYYDSLPSNPSSDGGSTFNATTTPQWQNIVISNLSGSTVSSPSKGIGDIWGVPESPINGVLLDNVVVNGTTKTLVVNHARNISYADGTALPLASGSDDLFDVSPVITTQPASQLVAAGATVTFTVAAASTAAPTYQWSKNGAAISGATSATLTLTNVQAASAGGYAVTVKNATGSNTSDDAILQVN
ncbi:MAG TPA: glycosyl hydrolase family 28 protein, partial [Opitutaceae bacterium]|nr:glycosyl hydrolase family 28 protein [Opitutaceae bacterium]